MTEIEKADECLDRLNASRTRLAADRFRVDAIYCQAKNHLANRQNLSVDLSYLCCLIVASK